MGESRWMRKADLVHHRKRGPVRKPGGRKVELLEEQMEFRAATSGVFFWLTLADGVGEE
jgi:hypothetical protein